MTAYAAVNTLSLTDAAYIAGLIDGEGSITLTQEHRNERRRLVVSIANTELALLEFVRQAAGAGRITRKRTYSAIHTPSHAYKITNRQALALLGQISPFLKSYKRRRAELVLDQYLQLTPRNGRYVADAANKRAAFENAVLAILPERESGQEKARLNTLAPSSNRHDGESTKYRALLGTNVARG